MITRWYFSIAAILNPTRRAEGEILDEMGRLTARYARESIGRSRQTSRPGGPPNSASGVYPRSIIHEVDQSSGRVRVFATRFASANGYSVPEILEFGGTVTRTRKTSSGRTIRIVQRYRARPHVRPAGERAAKHFPRMWKNAIHN